MVENLNDIDVGAWQGLTEKEVRRKYPELYRDWLDTPEQVRLPGGETLAEVRGRAVPFVEEAVRNAGKAEVVLVSHRAVNKVLICALLGLDNASFWNIKLDTGGITRFICEGGQGCPHRVITIPVTSARPARYLLMIFNRAFSQLSRKSQKGGW